MNELIKYSAEENNFQVMIANESVWLTQAQMVDLFQRDKSVISRHVRNIFKEGELVQNSTVANFATVQIEGDREVLRNVEYYNLDVIISVGYRVKSKRGTEFRIWAREVLKEHLLKGYSVRQPVTVEQLNRLREDVNAAMYEIQDILHKQYKTEQEFGKVYEILSALTTKHIEDNSPRRRIGFLTPEEIKNEEIRINREITEGKKAELRQTN